MAPKVHHDQYHHHQQQQRHVASLQHESGARAAVVVTGLQRLLVDPEPLLHDAFAPFGRIAFLHFHRYRALLLLAASS
jgi:hypothetical protein